MAKHKPKEIWKGVPAWAKIGVAVVIFCAVMMIIGCMQDYIHRYPQDNIVEEIAEEVVKNKTGIDIDFSPFTPE